MQLIKRGWKSDGGLCRVVLRQFPETGAPKMIKLYSLKGRFLEFQRCDNFSILFSKLPESTFYKEMSKFQ